MRKFFSSKSGATTIEYGVIAAVILLAIVGALTFLGDGSNEIWTDVETKVTDNPAP